MIGMNIQDRYVDIANRSGLSEEVVRRVLKASRESLALSIKQGERATLPGICIILPEIKNRINIGGTSMTSYIKLKAKPSAAMESEVEKLSSFSKATDESENTEIVDENTEDNALAKLNFKNPDEIKFDPRTYGVRTSQISALL